jgi:hypothetical protein
MKRIFLILFLSSFLLISCDDDKYTNFEPKNYIAGTWTPTQLGRINNFGKVLYTPYVHESDNCKDNFILNENFTYENNEYDTNCENFKLSNTYRYDTGVLFLNTLNDLTNENEELSYNVKALTYTDLELSFTDEANKIVFVKFTR